MRFLADEDVPKAIVHALRAAGHDVAWVRETSPGIRDEAVLASALAEKRVLLTFDKDFGELVYRVGRPASCGVVFFRIPLEQPAVLASGIVQAIGSRDDWEGNFSVIEPGQIRMRALP